MIQQPRLKMLRFSEEERELPINVLENGDREKEREGEGGRGERERVITVSAFPAALYPLIPRLWKRLQFFVKNEFEKKSGHYQVLLGLINNLK